MLLGVDVGGTFTDAVLDDGETLHTAKAVTTPGEESAGVRAAVEAVLEAAGAEPGDVGSFAHGMTVGTNALLERRGARTALVTTAGFTDLLEIGRQDRPSLYHLCAPKPEPLVGAELRLGVAERIGPSGVIDELSEASLAQTARALREAEPESVAVCLLFSYLDPSHERAVAERLREELPGVHVSASHEVLAQFREYERCSTTLVDAYLSPLLGRYLARLSEVCASLGLPQPVVMRSSGGVAELSEATRSGAWSVLSGPAGGAVGAGLIAETSAEGNAVGLDMGGTSCDVCVVEEGAVRRTDAREIDGRVLQLPMVDVHTVGAGGGSIAWRDSGGALRVGPRSAGAEPGPACYGRGGSEPTGTDANLLLGYLDPRSRLAGGVALDADASRRAIAALARQIGLEETETAEGIVRVANNEMMRALRVVTVERGIDPRRFALMPFGGAGPMHAAALAEELEIERIVCPRASGVLSALGLAASAKRRDAARTVMLSGAELTGERIAAEVRALRRSIAAGMDGAAAECVYEMRYRGQAHELAIAAEATSPDPDELAGAFAAEHERRYGYRDDDAEVELVTIRLALVIERPRPGLYASTGASIERSRRRMRFQRSWVEAPVLRGEPEAGTSLTGPCVLELPQATFVIPPGWEASVDGAGSVIATREKAGGA